MGDVGLESLLKTDARETAIMTQKLTVISVILAAFIIALALVLHGRELAKLSNRLAALEQSSKDLELSLQKFSAELPVVIEQAGRKAGQQAVHGMVEEAFAKPMSWLGLASRQVANTPFARVMEQLQTNSLTKKISLSPLAPRLAQDDDSPPGQAVRQLDTNHPASRLGPPSILFDISQPVVQFETSVKIEILPGLKSLPDLPSPAEAVNPQTSAPITRQ